MEELGFESSSASVPNALLTMFGLPPWSMQNSEEFHAMSNLTSSVEINHQHDQRDFGNNISVEFRREEELTYDNVSLDNNNKFFYLVPHEFETMEFHSTSNMITTSADNAETAMKLASYSCLLNRPSSAGLVQDHDHQNVIDSQIQASIDSINCLVSLTNTIPDAAATSRELRRIDDPPVQAFCRENSVMSNQMNNWNVDYSGSGDYGGNRISSGVSSDSAAEHDEAVSNYPPINSHDDHKISIKRKFSEAIICNFKNTNGGHDHHADQNNYLSFDAYLSDYSPKGGGGFRLITESTTTCNKQQKRPKPEKPQRSSSNINFLNPNSPSFLEQDTEAIASMKEMIYRAAVMRPINLGMQVISEKPKRKNVRISSDPQTVAARHRRERISDRIRVLQRLVPGGSKMDTASMLDEAANYLKFLKSQVSALESLGNNSMQINNMNNHSNYNQLQYYCPPPPPFTINIP